MPTPLPNWIKSITLDSDGDIQIQVQSGDQPTYSYLVLPGIFEAVAPYLPDGWGDCEKMDEVCRQRSIVAEKQRRLDTELEKLEVLLGRNLPTP